MRSVIVLFAMMTIVYGQYQTYSQPQYISAPQHQKAVFRPVAQQVPQVIRRVVSQPVVQPVVRRVVSQPVVRRVVSRPVQRVVQTVPVSTGYQEEYYGPSEPYNFGFESTDEYGTKLTRQEDSDGSVVKGSYGYTDANGLYRQVDYVADAGGFRATVRTNEPGTAKADPAHVQFFAEEPPASAYASSGRGQYAASASHTRPIILGQSY